jgi:hypothetical protein
MLSMARAHLGAGEINQAKELYQNALVAEEDSVSADAVNWDMEYIKALQEPLQLDEAYLQKLAGDYETRHLTVKDGILHYFRENVVNKEPKPLNALAEDVFIMEGTTYFRLKVAFDDEGNPEKLVGLYSNGYSDESMRDE